MTAFVSCSSVLLIAGARKCLETKNAVSIDIGALKISQLSKQRSKFTSASTFYGYHEASLPLKMNCFIDQIF